MSIDVSAEGDHITERDETEPLGKNWLHRVENAVNVGAIILLSALPVAEILVRLIFRAGIPDASGTVKNTVLLVGFLGGMLAAREDQHLAIAAATLIKSEKVRSVMQFVSLGLAVTFGTAFFVSSIEWIITAFGPGFMVGIIPVRVFGAVVPLAFLVMTIRFAARIQRSVVGWVTIAVAVLLGLSLAIGSLTNLVYTVALDIPEFIYRLEGFWYSLINVVALPLLVILIASAAIGTPLFIVLTGAAYLLFARGAGIVAVVPNEGYAMLTSNTIAAIPMFTFVGYVLSESNAGTRLFRLFRALFGWLPGGMVIASILVSVFFATFTGASGVVILALGGLLYVILHKRGNQSEGFTIGLITGVGDLGLLFPPSLVLILYATSAQISVLDMFLGGLLPGALTVLVFCVVGVFVSLRRGEHRQKFDAKEAAGAIGESIWEVLLPVVIVAGYFTGLTTLVETGAVAVLYVIIVEMVIHREFSWSDLRRAGVKSAIIMGGVLVILAGAKALSYYIVDTQLPFILVDLVETYIDSKIVFLLLLNVVLLIAGMFMDIFSALVVIVPLIIPLGQVFGINAVHLGVIFVANMALGFMTPPVGLELFLSSYRFGKPLTKIYRYVFPFFVLQTAAVLLITYVPWFTTVLIGGG